VLGYLGCCGDGDSRRMLDVRVIIDRRILGSGDIRVIRDSGY
jgi:hypothetical protein